MFGRRSCHTSCSVKDYPGIAPYSIRGIDLDRSWLVHRKGSVLYGPDWHGLYSSQYHMRGQLLFTAASLISCHGIGVQSYASWRMEYYGTGRWLGHAQKE